MRWNTKKEEKSNEKQKGILLGRLKEKKKNLYGKDLNTSHSINLPLG